MAVKKKVKRPKKGKKPAKRKSAVRKKAVRKVVRKKIVKKKVAKRKVVKKKTKAISRSKAPAKKTVFKPAPLPAPMPIKPAFAPVAPQPVPQEERLGVVTHYYTHLGVAIVRLETGVVREGDTVRFKGHTSDFTQTVGSIEVNHMHINEVRAPQSFGMKVKEHARENDVVYRVKTL